MTRLWRLKGVDKNGVGTLHRIVETGNGRFPFRLACSEARFGREYLVRHMTAVDGRDSEECPRCAATRLREWPQGGTDE